MTRFGNQALAGLERLYRFAGGLKGSQEVDIEAPVTLVHDVTPSAVIEMGRFISISTPRTAGLGSTVRGSLTYSTLLANFGDLAKSLGIASPAFWWISTQMTLEQAPDNNLAFCGTAVRSVGPGHIASGGAQIPGIMVAVGDAALAGIVIAGDDNHIVWTNGGAVFLPADFMRPPGRPIYLSPQGSLTAGSAVHDMVSATGGGSAKVFFNHKLWMGPAGHSPPPFE